MKLFAPSGASAASGNTRPRCHTPAPSRACGFAASPSSCNGVNAAANGGSFKPNPSSYTRSTLSNHPSPLKVPRRRADQSMSAPRFRHSRRALL